MSRVDAPTANEAKKRWTQTGVVLENRRKYPVVDFGFTFFDDFSRHRTGLYSALLSYFGFLSVFPLFIVLTTILGFVLEDNPELQSKIVDSAFANIPFIGETIANNPADLHGSTLVLVAGLLTSLWAGTRAFAVAQTAMNDIWEVPELERPNLATKRLRALVAIVIVGVAQISTGLLSGVLGVGDQGEAFRIALVTLTVAINITSLMASYRVLTARRLTARQLLAGAVGGGLALSVLQVVGGSIVTRAIKRASPVYGSFATVIALLGWLTLHALVALCGAELNATLDRRRTSTSTVLP